MKTHHWYIAKISWGETNTPYNAIIQCYWDGEDSIFDVIEHDGRTRVSKSKLHSFEIVKEIEEMNEKFKKKVRC